MLKIFKSKISNLKKNKYHYNNKQEMLQKMHHFSQSYFHNVGEPIWTERNYSTFSNEAYKNNVIAYRCIKMISEAASMIPIKLYQIKQDEKLLIKEHPILRLLKNPNPTQSFREFFESIYTYKQLSGNAYILGIGLDKIAGIINSGESNITESCELYTLRPDRVEILAGHQYNIPYGYRYKFKDNSNEYIEYLTNELTGISDILHIKDFNPLSDYYGMSAVEAAAFSIDQHNNASAWNQSLLQNAARPNGALIVQSIDGKPMILSDLQRNNLKQAINEHCGPNNAGKPLLLEGGLRWEKMSMTQQEMDFIECKNTAAREIALAFGVPPQLLGIPGDNTYSNMTEARKALWEQTVLPMAQKTIENINRWINIHCNNKNLLVELDISKITSLSDRTESFWNRVEDASFLSNKEKREMVGLSESGLD